MRTYPVYLVTGLCIIIIGAAIGLPFVSAGPVQAPPGPGSGDSIPINLPPTATRVTAPIIAATPTTTQANAPLPLPPSPTIPVQPLTCGILTNFEQFGTWTRGDEPYGTFTQSAEQVYSGFYSGKLAYNFPTAGNDYVVFLRNIPMGGKGAALTAWVYGDNSGHYLNAWVKDATGEVWSFTFGQIQHVGWQQMSAPFNTVGAWPNGHVSGPANGLLEYPISLNALVLDDAPDSYAGSGAIYIEDLSCSEVTTAPSQQTVPVAPAQQPGGPQQLPVGPQQPQQAGGCVVTLLGPPEGAEYGDRTETVNLQWQFNRALDPREYFFVNVEFPHGGQTWYDGTWRDPGQQLPSGTRDTSWTLRDYLCGPGFSDTGWYKWYVSVLYQLGPEKSLSDGFVCRSEKRNFKWTGCYPTPEPRPDNEYDLYVRRMDYTPANPRVGDTVTMYIMIATDISPDGGPYFPASHFHWRKDGDSGWNEESCGDNTHYANCEKTVTFKYNSAGGHDFKVEADNRNEVGETDEANNDKKWTINVSP